MCVCVCVCVCVCALCVKIVSVCGVSGTIAIQLLKHLGATVIVSASAKDAPLLTQLGASQIIDYHTQQFQDVLADQPVSFSALYLLVFVCVCVCVCCVCV